MTSSVRMQCLSLNCEKLGAEGGSLDALCLFCPVLFRVALLGAVSSTCVFVISTVLTICGLSIK